MATQTYMSIYRIQYLPVYISINRNYHSSGFFTRLRAKHVDLVRSNRFFYGCGADTHLNNRMLSQESWKN